MDGMKLVAAVPAILALCLAATLLRWFAIGLCLAIDFFTRDDRGE
jgi:hypothetical protein